MERSDVCSPLREGEFMSLRSVHQVGRTWQSHTSPWRKQVHRGDARFEGCTRWRVSIYPGVHSFARLPGPVFSCRMRRAFSRT